MKREEMLSSDFENIGLLEALYEQYRQDPASVDSSWKKYFSQIDSHPAPVEKITKATGEQRIYRLIQAYRLFGHLFAQINPVAIKPLEEPWQLKLSTYGFSDQELEEPFPTLGLLPQPTASLKEIIEGLRQIYCRHIGFDYSCLQNPEAEQWLQNQIESTRCQMGLSIEQKKMILQALNKSELLEHFLHTKYTAQKRFSLEGAETLIPIFSAIIEKSAEMGAQELILGMSHRGRLNILANILNKSYADIFSEFESGYIPSSSEGSGDVKYHKGYSAIVTTPQGAQVKITLMPNPSHLESADPVVLGFTRARQIKLNDDFACEKAIPILMHGDAAIAGQGMVYEMMQFSHLKGYRTGGTIHIVINNQIGFTTIPEDSRSTLYCTDIARTFNAPVFHVNAEDPEACIFIAYLAAEMRARFHSDLFIDLNCYRKYGHNEGDEPAFTQPIEYQLIRSKRPIRELYLDALVQQGVLEKQIAESLETEFKSALLEAKEKIKLPSANLEANASLPEEKLAAVNTGVSAENLRTLAEKFCVVPEGLAIHPKLKRLIDHRLEMAQGKQPIDWGMAEMLAYATLLNEGRHVRISGQDSCRGTFSHRHAIWIDQAAEKVYFPLKHLAPQQGRFDIFNSPLSEYACMGFEYGYSVAYPSALTIWEAQFGDFCNGGQIIIDQFISSGEQKWKQQSNLVLFLPHGFEGQGPEHSSARIERFLSLAAENNMAIVNPTTPAQLFHLLRRHLHLPEKKPLIVFTPKAYLRHPDCISQLIDFENHTFAEIMDDPMQPLQAKRMAFCSGKIYYEIAAVRKNRKIDDLAIIRIEQLYPLDTQALTEMIKNYPHVKTYLWVQEEPSNMGAWMFMHPLLKGIAGADLQYIGRGRHASPGTGSHTLHSQEEEAILNQIANLKV